MPHVADALTAETIRIAGHGGDEISAYLAQPMGDGPFGGVVVIHHMPGWDRWSKEVTRTFAAAGYLAICPNLHEREGKGASPGDSAAAVRAAGGVPDERLVGDVDGAARHLRSLPSSNGRLGVIGYCSGGRQSFLAACKLPFDFCVDSYGRIEHAADVAGLRGPLLLILASDDEKITGWAFSELLPALNHAKRRVDVQVYPGVRHAFQRPGWEGHEDRAANDAWQRTLEFLARVRSETGYLPSA